MPRRKPDKKVIALVKSLYEDGTPVTQIAKKAKIPYMLAYAYAHGFASSTEYREHLARQKGFASYSEYQEHLARQKPENQEFGKLIKTRLKEIGRNQSWLAEQLDVSRQAVSLYAKGIMIPNGNRLKRLASVLKIKYETLRDLFELE